MNAIKPPRKPRGESLKVTMAMQEKQIQLLINRVESLNNMLTASNHRIDEVAEERDDAMKVIETRRLLFEEFERSMDRLRGWQECAREVMGIDLKKATS